MNTSTDTSQPDNKNTIPKAYCSPQLIEYGNIQQLTNAVGNMGMNDGGSLDMQKKTQP